MLVYALYITTDLKDVYNGLVKHMSAGAKTYFWAGQKPRRDACALYLSTAKFRSQTIISDCGWSTTRFPLPGTTWDCLTRRRHTARTLWASFFFIPELPSKFAEVNNALHKHWLTKFKAPMQASGLMKRRWISTSRNPTGLRRMSSS